MNFFLARHSNVGEVWRGRISAVHWNAVDKAMPILYQLTIRTNVVLAAAQTC